MDNLAAIALRILVSCHAESASWQADSDGNASWVRVKGDKAAKACMVREVDGHRWWPESKYKVEVRITGKTNGGGK